MLLHWGFRFVHLLDKAYILSKVELLVIITIELRQLWLRLG